MIGLQRGIVKLEKHTKAWSKLFEKEKRRLLQEIKNTSVVIEHIGSTSIPGIKAKPTLDIAFGVASMKEWKKHMKTLEKAGYIWRPRMGKVGKHLVFAKGNEKTRTHYLHLMKVNGKEWNDHIFFRDYLRSRPKIARAYEKLKEKSMSEFPEDRRQYQKQKNPFIAKILKGR